MKRPVNILLRWLMVAIPLLMALAPARAQIVVYSGQTMNFEVVDVPGETYAWEIYNDFTAINMAVVPGNCPASDAFFPAGNTGSAVDITWIVPGTYLVKVTAVNACPSNNIKFYKVEVLPPMVTATLVINPAEICRGDSADLIVTFTGDAPWGFVLEADDGINPPVTTTYSGITDNPYIVVVLPVRTTTYRVTEVTDANGINTNPSNVVTLTVKPRPAGSQIYQYGP